MNRERSPSSVSIMDRPSITGMTVYINSDFVLLAAVLFWQMSRVGFSVNLFIFSYDSRLKAFRSGFIFRFLF